jgi:hypothetical protein
LTGNNDSIFAPSDFNPFPSTDVSYPFRNPSNYSKEKNQLMNMLLEGFHLFYFLSLVPFLSSNIMFVIDEMFEPALLNATTNDFINSSSSSLDVGAVVTIHLTNDTAKVFCQCAYDYYLQIKC